MAGNGVEDIGEAVALAVWWGLIGGGGVVSPVLASVVGIFLAWSSLGGGPV